MGRIHVAGNVYSSASREKSAFSRFQEMLWWQPQEESLPFAFCQDTSLHGLKYIGQPKRHFLERLFWFSTFVTAIVVACILINGVWVKYKNSPVIVSFQNKETKVEQIPFPAITICNVNNVLQSNAHKFIKIAEEEEELSDASDEALMNLFLLNHICSSMALSFSQKFGYNANGSTVPKALLDKVEGVRRKMNGSKRKQQQDVKKFLQENAQTCENMINLCLWQDEVQNCTEIFQPIETDFGKCCTFNMVPQSLMYKFTNDTRDKEIVVEEWAQGDLDVDDLLLKEPGQAATPFPRRTKQSGSTYGLSFVLNPNLGEYFCATADGTGFQLVTHLPTQVPHVVDYGIAIDFNKEVYITVTPEITTSDKAVFDIPLIKRRCYFDGEFTLKYYNYYTESNCIEECIANVTFQFCRCVRYFMPTDSERQLCEPSVLPCLQEVSKKFAQDGFTGDCQNCLPSCTEINYVTTTSTSPIRNDVEIWIKEDTVSSISSKNISIVHVYFGKGSTYSKIRKELYGFTDLIANTGGLLGLCLGFSALSALEVVYFLTLRAWFVFRSTKRKPNNLEHQEPIKIITNEGNIIPIPIGDTRTPYSQFIFTELYTYYNKAGKPKY